MLEQQELSSLVQTYIEDATDEHDKKQGTRVLELIKSTPDFWRRSNFNPGHVTASGFVVNESRTSVLLTHHSKVEKWLQLGGHVESEDVDIFKAALREVKEESGLDGTVNGKYIFDIDVHSIAAYGDEPAHKHFDICLLIYASDTQALKHDSMEGEPRWLKRNDIPTYNNEARIIRLLNKLQNSVD